MAMQTLSFKEQDGIVPSGPWWSALGSQSTYGESYGQSNKPLPIGIPRTGDQLIFTSKQSGRGCTEQLLGTGKGNTTQFSIFSGDGQKHQTTTPMLDCRPRFELGFGQPMICAKYPHVDQCYGVLSYGSQISGRIMLPLDDGPVYVNPKQYHGIIRRRQSRAKAAVLGNRMSKPRRPYMHRSRHLHAMRRPRGCGGRFLNTKKMNDIGKSGNELNKVGDRQLLQHSGSLSSELLQSESGILNSSKEANCSSSIISGSEVTSMFSRGELDHHFAINLGPSAHALSDMIGGPRGMIMPTWVAAADSCCNLKV